jgi:hypothetical protein
MPNAAKPADRPVEPPTRLEPSVGPKRGAGLGASRCRHRSLLRADRRLTEQRARPARATPRAASLNPRFTKR